MCALVSFELQSPRPVSQRMHVERGYSRDFYSECLLSYDIPASFQILLTQLRDGRSRIVSKGEIPSLNKYIESLCLLLANPFPCCFRPHLFWDELGAGH